MNVNNPRTITVEYYNRHNEKLIFEKINNNIKLTEYFGMGVRAGFDKDPENITFIDPSGGPYLSIGDDMGIFNKKFDGLIIQKLSFGDKCINIKVGN